MAIKILREELADESAAREDLFKEARALGRMESSRVLKVIDSGDSEIGPYLVLERLQGQDLEGLAQDCEGPLSVADAAWLVRRALLGVSQLHQQGILHLDLKPANLFLHREGPKRWEVKVTDLGHACILDESQRGHVLPRFMRGTPLYMAPEQRSNAAVVDESADLYAMAAVLLRLVAGVEALETLRAKRDGARPDPDTANEQWQAHLPPGAQPLAPVLGLAFDAEPQKRYPSAQHFADALASYEAGARWETGWDNGRPALSSRPEALASSPGAKSGWSADRRAIRRSFGAGLGAGGVVAAALTWAWAAPAGLSMESSARLGSMDGPDKMVRADRVVAWAKPAAAKPNAVKPDEAKPSEAKPDIAVSDRRDKHPAGVEAAKGEAFVRAAVVRGDSDNRDAELQLAAGGVGDTKKKGEDLGSGELGNMPAQAGEGESVAGAVGGEGRPRSARLRSKEKGAGQRLHSGHRGAKPGWRASTTAASRVAAAPTPESETRRGVLAAGGAGIADLSPAIAGNSPRVDIVDFEGQEIASPAATSGGASKSPGARARSALNRSPRRQAKRPSPLSSPSSLALPSGIHVAGDLMVRLERAPRMSFLEAKAYCKELDRLDSRGILGWRLPRPEELEALAGRFQGPRGIYWSDSLRGGKAKVVTLPRGRVAWVRIRRRLIRPFCVAPRQQSEIRGLKPETAIR